jgi:hypothetical protein
MRVEELVPRLESIGQTEVDLRDDPGGDDDGDREAEDSGGDHSSSPGLF